MRSSNGDDKSKQIDHAHSFIVGLIVPNLENKDRENGSYEKNLVINEEGMEMLRRYEKLKQECDVEDKDLEERGSVIYKKYNDEVHRVICFNSLAEMGLILFYATRLSIISSMAYLLPALFFLIALSDCFSALKRAKKSYADLGMTMDIFTNRNINFIRLATAFRDYCIAGRCTCDSTSSLRRPHEIVNSNDLFTVNERLEELLKPSAPLERMRREYRKIGSSFIAEVVFLAFLMLGGVWVVYTGVNERLHYLR